MKKKKRILVFGYFGYITNQLDGQTVKTRAIYDLLQNNASAYVTYSDTQEFRHNLKSILLFIYRIIRCDKLIWLPAHNNLKYLFPFIWLFSKIFQFDIIYIVIGGWLSTVLEKLSFHRNKLRGIKAILLENKLTCQELEIKFKFNNLNIIPNFREKTPIPNFPDCNNPLKLVFMARINKLKGLDTIAAVAEQIKDRGINIDLYGPIFHEDEQYFKNMLIDRYNFVNYNGVIQPDNIYQTLVGYDAMLFPTHYYTEGFPGSIMDSFRCAIPVIATNWKYATEFITDNVSGFIVDFDNPVDGIVQAINTIDSDRRLLTQMKKAAYCESLRYTPDVAWRILKKFLN